MLIVEDLRALAATVCTTLDEPPVINFWLCKDNRRCNSVSCGCPFAELLDGGVVIGREFRRCNSVSCGCPFAELLDGGVGTVTEPPSVMERRFSRCFCNSPFALDSLLVTCDPRGEAPVKFTGDPRGETPVDFTAGDNEFNSGGGTGLAELLDEPKSGSGLAEPLDEPKSGSVRCGSAPCTAATAVNSFTDNALETLVSVSMVPSGSSFGVTSSVVAASPAADASGSLTSGVGLPPRKIGHFSRPTQVAKPAPIT